MNVCSSSVCQMKWKYVKVDWEVLYDDLKFIMDHISHEELQVYQAKIAIRLCTPFGNFGKTETCHAFLLLCILSLNTDGV
jgi:hypothetical protein